MTPQEAASQVVEIWNQVADAINDRVSKATPMEARIAMFEQANDWMIHKAISAEHAEQRAATPPKPKTDTPCVSCGKMLTEGEKKYCDDNDKQYRCYKCSKK